jgi:hypothetical protein
VFELTDHVVDDVLPDPMRFVTRDMVDETIKDGTDFDSEGGVGKTRRKLDYDGVYAVVVLSREYPVVVTAWTEINSWADALSSDRWSQDDLETIRAFEDREHKHWPGR